MSDPIELKNIVIDQMRQAVTKRDSFLLNMSGTSSDFRIILGDIINLNPNLDYEIALIRFEEYNSLYNVTSINNKFRYYNGTEWKTITLSPGAYEIAAINEEIQRQMTVNKDVKIANDEITYYFKLCPNF